MNRYKVIRIISFIIFIVAFLFWGYNKILYLDSSVTYEELKKRAVKTAEKPKDTQQAEANEQQAEANEQETENNDLEIDHNMFMSINRDYVCYLTALNGKISYPVVKGENNEEYLHRTFFGDNSFVGSIFIDSRCSEDLDDFQTLFYGHSLKDGTMFRALADLTDQSIARSAPQIDVYTQSGKQSYSIFSVCLLKDNELITATGERTTEQKETFLNELKQRSLYTIGQMPSAEDKIITLITCDVRDDGKRVLVNAVKI